jgi:uncharacterized membrane-anchored protein
VASADQCEAAEFYERALELAPDLLPLAVEAITAQLDAELPKRAAALLEAWNGETSGRLLFLTARTRLALGDAAGARAVFEAGFEVPNIREGETSLSDTWAAVTATPLPAEYDFRMTPP